ncbi:MAG: hypothetical protein WC718_11885 [Phycisphaerales bacterium]|jgi:hypothetical protein
MIRITMTRVLAAAATSVALALGACSSTGDHSAKAAAKAEDPAAHAQGPMMKFVSRLAGDWEMKGPDGKPMLAMRTHVMAGGSAVAETMFPGGPHEMINMYHLDGDELVMTHYCASGNQPRMQCSSTDGKSVELTLRDVTNRLDSDETYMGYLKVTLVDDDHLIQEWKNFSGNKEMGKVRFEFTRAKG